MWDTYAQIAGLMLIAASPFAISFLAGCAIETIDEKRGDRRD
jgi:hypothetical protein